MELRDYIRILRKSWILLAILTVAGGGASAAYSQLQTPIYSAASKVFVSTSSGQSATDLVQGNNFTVQRVKTYSDLATTPIVLLPVISKLGLDIPVEVLARNTVVSAALDTTIIEISVSNPNAAMSAEIANSIAESLSAEVERIETPNLEGATSPVMLALVQEAKAPAQPVSPKTMLNIGLGALIGLIIGFSVALLREALDTRIRGEADVQQITPKPIVGTIAFDPKSKQRPLIVHADPRSARAESFRTLRTNLSFLETGTGKKTFVVTSSIESEGKSTTCANLAISLADSGVRVLLVDADLRKPKVAEYMSIEGAVGLTDVIIGRAELRDVLQPWGRSGLVVLPAGKIPPNPSEILGSKAMTDLIAEFEREYDAVIFDAPPLLPVTDAAVLAKKVGGAIVVVAAGRTHKNQLRGAVDALAKVGAPVAGLVLTMVPTKGPDAYGYGYGYGYGQDAGAKPDEADANSALTSQSR